MKRKIAALVVFIAIAVMSISGTMAYFTAEETATNVITSGKIDIQLIEKDEFGNTFEKKDGVMPGEKVTKIVTVKNAEDANAAYVRIKVIKNITLADNDKEADLDLIQCNFNEEDWEYKDGYWYYKEALAKGEETSALFTTVTFSTEMGNEYQNCTATIDVYAEAVQVDNNNGSAIKAVGWPEDLPVVE